MLSLGLRDLLYLSFIGKNNNVAQVPSTSFLQLTLVAMASTNTGFPAAPGEEVLGDCVAALCFPSVFPYISQLQLLA